jgi:S-methylmethionine-dependent homocysteine/selenocysteine methylase
VERDEILRQGMQIAGRLRDEAGEQAAAHEQQIKDVLGKVAGFVNEKTEGRYAEHVDKAAGFLEQGLETLVEGARKPGPDGRPPSA